MSLVEQLQATDERQLVNELKAVQSCFCIVNTTLYDNPITFASKQFYALTGKIMSYR